MANILVVTGSVRPNSVNEKMVPYVVDAAKAKGATVTVANLKELDLPFFDDVHSPTAPDFAPTHEQVKKWTQLVVDAEGVLFVTPEYNHTMSPVQMNAIDWIGKEWQGKPIALIGYGWRSGGEQAHMTAREALAVNLKANVLDTQTNLYFMRDLSPDGTIIDAEAVKEKVSATIDELLAAAS
jgi:NAD(P)H-dependent FMN reductase